MYYAHLAGVNVGVMTAIWGVQPLFAAGLDYLIYREPFLWSYLIGIIMMIACAVCISFKKTTVVEIDIPTVNIHIEVDGFPVWPAILFGFITPCVFCCQALYNKHMTNPRVGFDATTLSFGSSCVAATFLLFIGVTFWW